MSRLLNRQRQLAEAGRLRLGYTTESSNGKTRPVRSETWILTSHSEEIVAAAAATWGGTPDRWQPLGNGAKQWRVITTSSSIDAILPPGDPLTQAYEQWGRGGAVRRCDGATEQFSGSPCLCIAEFGEQWYEQKKGTVCDTKSRLRVLLPALPGLGSYRVETGSFYAADEIAGMVDFIRSAVGEQALLPIRLRIEPRTRVAGGETKQFVVPVVELRGVTTGQVLEGGSNLLQITTAGASPEQRTAIEGGSGSAPVEHYVTVARACYSLAGWREVWQTAAANGHLTDELKAQLTAIGEALAKAQREQAAAPAEPVADPDDVWMQIVATCPEDWTTPYLEQDFAQWADGVIPADADAATLAGYLDQLKAGAR